MTETTGTVKFLGVEIPNPPRWAIAALSAVLVAAVAAFFWLKVGVPIAEQRGAAKHALADLAHYQKHVMEPRMSERDVYDGLTVGFYSSDRCLVAIRKSNTPGTLPQLRYIPEAQYVQAPGPIAFTFAASSFATLAIALPGPGPIYGAIPAAGNCIKDHPGKFESWWGQERNGCWTALWRRWPDGCIHYQWFCGQQPDLNPDGSPRVYWRNCVH